MQSDPRNFQWWWMGRINQDNITKAFDYWIYLALTLYIIKQSEVNTAKEFIVVQDNLVWHHSVQVKRLSNSEHVLMHFLPSYQSTLAGYRVDVLDAQKEDEVSIANPRAKFYQEVKEASHCEDLFVDPQIHGQQI